MTLTDNNDDIKPMTTKTVTSVEWVLGFILLFASWFIIECILPPTMTRDDFYDAAMTRFVFFHVPRAFLSIAIFRKGVLLCGAKIDSRSVSIFIVISSVIMGWVIEQRYSISPWYLVQPTSDPLSVIVLLFESINFCFRVLVQALRGCFTVCAMLVAFAMLSERCKILCSHIDRLDETISTKIEEQKPRLQEAENSSAGARVTCRDENPCRQALWRLIHDDVHTYGVYMLKAFVFLDLIDLTLAKVTTLCYSDDSSANAIAETITAFLSYVAAIQMLFSSCRECWVSLLECPIEIFDVFVFSFFMDFLSGELIDSHELQKLLGIHPSFESSVSWTLACTNAKCIIFSIVLILRLMIRGTFLVTPALLSCKLVKILKQMKYDESDKMHIFEGGLPQPVDPDAAIAAPAEDLECPNAHLKGE
jgi:hypothetical protein